MDFLTIVSPNDPVAPLLTLSGGVGLVKKAYDESLSRCFLREAEQWCLLTEELFFTDYPEGDGVWETVGRECFPFAPWEMVIRDDRLVGFMKQVGVCVCGMSTTQRELLELEKGENARFSWGVGDSQQSCALVNRSRIPEGVSLVKDRRPTDLMCW